MKRTENSFETGIMFKNEFLDKRFLYFALFAFFYYQSSIMSWTRLAALAGGLAIVGFTVVNRKLIYVILKTLPRDVRGGWRFSRVLKRIAWADKNNYTVAKIFDLYANKNPNKVCFCYENETWTFQQVQHFSNRVGNFFSSHGFQKGDTVALFMENRPEYVCIWMGLNKIGVTAALVNYNLRLEPLLHSLQIVNSKAVIYGHELSNAIEELLEMNNPFLSNVKLFLSGNKGVRGIGLNGVVVDLDNEILSVSHVTPIELNDMKLNDSLYYIYTSGTTGMPKAAVIKQYRFMMATNGVHFMNQVTEHDVLYDPLPLYHMTGGMVGIGQALLFGTTVVIRNKFSASQFWLDCKKYNVTVAQYLGETCRYLLAQPPSSNDKDHKVRIMVGNGLRHEIWEEFTTRFNIKEIGEVYGSTEGNCNISNIDSKVGAVGFVPRILYPILPMTLVRIDDITGEPIRHPKTGLVVRCRPNEPGELIGKIIKQHPIRDFQGYTDEASTSKKILTDVFEKGDMAFRTGDVLMMDDYGYFYFKDRTGDTFRWKGENVSSTEVESIIINQCGFKDVVVYGVPIPKTEGKAGMAAIADPDGCLNLEHLAKGIVKSLPPYARPLFIRVLDKIDTTGTYKMKKMALQKQGYYNFNRVHENVYFFMNNQYCLLDNNLLQKINTGQVKL